MKEVEEEEEEGRKGGGGGGGGEEGRRRRRLTFCSSGTCGTCRGCGRDPGPCPAGQPQRTATCNKRHHHPSDCLYDSLSVCMSV